MLITNLKAKRISNPMLIEKDQSTVEQVRKWGYMISDAVLDPDALIFNAVDCEGLIGYRLESGCAVVIGDPVCPEEEMERLVRRFHQFCKENGWSVIYLIASQKFKDWAMGKVCHGAIEFGQELFVDPSEVKKENGKHKGRHLRYKLRRAANEGVTVFEHSTYDLDKENEMERVKNEWLKNREGFQFYISPIYLFTNRLGKRWFYAEYNGEVVAVLLLNELQARGGWIVNRYMTTEKSPVGTIELLLSTAIDTLKEEGSHFFSFGPVEAEKLGKIQGLSVISAWIAQGLFKLALKFFNMGGRRGFWERFHPKAIDCYILFDKSNVGLKEMLALIRAMRVEIKR